MSTKVSGYELKGTMVQVTGEVDGQPVTAAGPSYGVTKAKSPAHMQRYLETLLVNRHAMAPTEFKTFPEQVKDFNQAQELLSDTYAATGRVEVKPVADEVLAMFMRDSISAINDLQDRMTELESLRKRGFWDRLLWLLFGK
jgi:hypothetical protein